MTSVTELNFDDLDRVSSGTGSLSDVMTYVKAYVAALGTVEAPPTYLPPAGMGGCNTNHNGVRY